MPIPFCKFNGFGNEYIVIERRAIPSDVSVWGLAEAICSRDSGVGADGIAILEKIDNDDADYFCEIVNPDGGVAGFSGNGTRCAVAYLHYKGLWSDPRLRLRTRSGVKTYDLIEHRGDSEFWFKAEVGKPRFAGKEIPVLIETDSDTLIDRTINVDGRDITFSAINVGNPVAGIFVDNFANTTLVAFGKSSCVSIAFPTDRQSRS